MMAGANTINPSGSDYAARLAAAACRADVECDSAPSEDEDDFDNEDSCFTTATIDSRVSGVIFDHPAP
jgi:hypothetical protein